MTFLMIFHYIDKRFLVMKIVGYGINKPVMFCLFFYGKYHFVK